MEAAVAKKDNAPVSVTQKTVFPTSAQIDVGDAATLTVSVKYNGDTEFDGQVKVFFEGFTGINPQENEAPGFKVVNIPSQKTAHIEFKIAEKLLQLLSKKKVGTARISVSIGDQKGHTSLRSVKVPAELLHGS